MRIKRPLVIDSGTNTLKSGYAGETRPQSVFPTVLGYNRYASIMPDVEHYIREYYVGEEAETLRGVLRLVYPIESGLITDWDAMEKIWHYVFHTNLQINPSEHPILFTEDPLNPPHNREKMAEILFEIFNVPAIAVISTAFLSLRALEKATGLVVDIGDGGVQIVPIYENSVITAAIARMDVSGRVITDYLGRLIRQRGYTLRARMILRDIKERLCYIILDPQVELSLTRRVALREKNYILPDGECISLGLELFLAPEVLFNPAYIGHEEDPLHICIKKSIQKCEINMRKELYQNIVLTGGSSLFPGLKERLHKELTKMLPEATKVRIIASPERKLSAWLGGSMLASQRFFSKFWVWRADYQEHGSAVARYGMLSKLFDYPWGRDLISINFTKREICPFCGALETAIGQEKETGKYFVFCPACKNKT
ncbi:MAG: actin, cytoplasmic 2 [Promethearchaeota archaeon]